MKASKLGTLAGLSAALLSAAVVPSTAEAVPILQLFVEGWTYETYNGTLGLSQIGSPTLYLPASFTVRLVKPSMAAPRLLVEKSPMPREPLLVRLLGVQGVVKY